MKPGLFDRIQRAFRSQPALHPVEERMAQRWVKQRLIVVYPLLRNNPRALEEAYQALSLDPRPGDEEGDAETVFEMSAPELPS